MILVDTSIWIDHFRAKEPLLAELLDANRVLIHPFIIGELACGNLGNRNVILSLLRKLPAVQLATDAETLLLIERQSLMGKGIGYIDAHLLAAVFLTATARVCTRDKRFNAIVSSMHLAFDPP